MDKIPEITINIQSVPVTATTRKLRARWGPEMAQDLQAFHGLDGMYDLELFLRKQLKKAGLKTSYKSTRA
jgi:hypothetical protein